LEFCVIHALGQATMWGKSSVYVGLRLNPGLIRTPPRVTPVEVAEESVVLCTGVERRATCDSQTVYNTKGTRAHTHRERSESGFGSLREAPWNKSRCLGGMAFVAPPLRVVECGVGGGRSCKKINRSHTHTPTEQHPRHRHTHTPTAKNKPPTNTSHKHLTTLEGGSTTVCATSHARVGVIGWPSSRHHLLLIGFRRATFERC